MDRETGIAIVKDFVTTYTIHDKKGMLLKDNADVIVETIRHQGRTFPITSAAYGPYATDKQVYENPLYANMMIQVKKIGEQSEVTINFMNIWYKKTLYTQSNTDVPDINTLDQFKTTGRCEKELFNTIEKYKN
ncbi:MAG: hypothetical protein IPI66_10740 [Chitinophagaceae bacterium]|nr:hypothetical protein [Chitinophagaceae bacterium]